MEIILRTQITTPRQLNRHGRPEARESLEREEMAYEDCEACLLASAAARTSMKAAELELKFSKDRWAKEKVEMEKKSLGSKLRA